MKILACAAFVSALSIAPAQADLTIVQNVEGAGPVGTSTMKIKGDKTRVESGPQVTTIIDGKSGEILTLFNYQKKFMRISAAQAKAAAELAMQPDEKGAPAVKPQLKASGKKETISGYETEEYTCEAPAFKGSYWIATKYPNAKAILQQLAATTPQNWNVAGKGMPDYRDFPGVPVRMRVSFSGKEIVTTLVSLKQDPLSDSEFIAPAGFEEAKMPDMDAMLGDKPATPKAASSPKQ